VDDDVGCHRWEPGHQIALGQLNVQPLQPVGFGYDAKNINVKKAGQLKHLYMKGE